jgi:sialic acid synthase SpsE
VTSLEHLGTVPGVVKWNDNKRDDFVNMVHNQHSELTSILGDLENIQLNNEGSQQDLHTSSIVINRDSNFGNTYLSKGNVYRIMNIRQNRIEIIYIELLYKRKQT